MKRLVSPRRFALWVDSKLVLQQSPAALRRRFFGSRAAAPDHDAPVFAAFRNLRRDHIDEERDWVWHHKCAEDVGRCEDLVDQWTTYEAEQAEPRWTVSTVAIEGSLLLQVRGGRAWARGAATRGDGRRPRVGTRGVPCPLR